MGAFRDAHPAPLVVTYTYNNVAVGQLPAWRVRRLLKLLLDAGADVHAADHVGQSALTMARVVVRQLATLGGHEASRTVAAALSNLIIWPEASFTERWHERLTGAAAAAAAAPFAWKLLVACLCCIVGLVGHRLRAGHGPARKQRDHFARYKRERTAATSDKGERRGSSACSADAPCTGSSMSAVSFASSAKGGAKGGATASGAGSGAGSGAASATAAPAAVAKVGARDRRRGMRTPSSAITSDASYSSSASSHKVTFAPLPRGVEQMATRKAFAQGRCPYSPSGQGCLEWRCEVCGQVWQDAMERYRSGCDEQSASSEGNLEAALSHSTCLEDRLTLANGLSDGLSIVDAAFLAEPTHSEPLPTRSSARPSPRLLPLPRGMPASGTTSPASRSRSTTASRAPSHSSASA